MIVLDIESSGLDTGKCGIWQIGSIDLENPKNYFLQEAKIDEEDEIEKEALIITGKTESELRNPEKQTQKSLILNFLGWVKSYREKIMFGQNVGWDITFIQNKCLRYKIMDKFRETMGVRSIDLHALAQLKHKEIHNKFLINESGRSEMSLKSILNFCGLEDKRKQSIGGEISEGGTPHNALEDCKLEGECYYRIMFGKNLFPEYSKFKIPEILKK